MSTTEELKFGPKSYLNLEGQGLGRPLTTCDLPLTTLQFCDRTSWQMVNYFGNPGLVKRWGSPVPNFSSSVVDVRFYRECKEMVKAFLLKRERADLVEKVLWEEYFRADRPCFTRTFFSTFLHSM